MLTVGNLDWVISKFRKGGDECEMRALWQPLRPLDPVPVLVVKPYTHWPTGVGFGLKDTFHCQRARVLGFFVLVHIPTVQT